MFGFIARWFAIPKCATVHKRPVTRRVRIGVEVLEGRALPSVSPLSAPAASMLMAQAPVQTAPVVKVTDFTGVVFHLVSSNGIAHDLSIKSETYSANGCATFTATWTADGVTSPVYQTHLSYDATGNIAITFNWSPSTTVGAFYGTITKLPSTVATQTTPYGNRYHLEGNSYRPPKPGTHVNPTTYYTGDGGIPFPVITHL